MPYVGAFSAADSPEADFYAIDFTKALAGDTIAGTPTVKLVVARGVDATPNSRLSGSVSVANNVVTQKLSGLQPGVGYHLQFTATTTNGRIISLWGSVECEVSP